MASENRQMLVGVLKFVSFILVILAVQFVAPYFITGTSIDVTMGICLLSWVLALAVQWAIGRVLDPWVHRQDETRVAQGPPPMGYPPPGYPYQGQPPYGAPPQYYRPPPPQYQRPPQREERSSIQSHVCKRCGGPVNASTRKCEMCGSKN